MFLAGRSGVKGIDFYVDPGWLVEHEKEKVEIVTNCDFQDNLPPPKHVKTL